MYALPPALNLVVIRSKDIERAHRFYSAMGLLLRPDAHGSDFWPEGHRVELLDRVGDQR
jgi:hypothetical protein